MIRVEVAEVHLLSRIQRVELLAAMATAANVLVTMDINVRIQGGYAVGGACHQVTPPERKVSLCTKNCIIYFKSDALAD